ncbi:nephrin-like isoform X2 [Stegodyphus dumicola]|uniref:nephrin-like isoform X2 n=1 Tax=Stegodyphus dumicola TaxID=202533 RepID=UPI0015AA5E44|nr:nephrin-like isoform X2 [Stegodyphus dumicola]
MRVDHSKSAYTLLVHKAQLDDEAEFQCQVGPGKNEKPIRSVARLTVLVPPKHLSINDLENGTEIEVREAEKLVLHCQAVSSKPATILKWYRKNIELMPEASRTTVRREGEKLYSTLSSVTLYPKGDTSGSMYTCEALHPALEKPLKATVCVGVLYPPQPPKINGYHEGDVIHVGDHLTLVCSSSGGKPRARIEWFRNGEVVEGNSSILGRDSSNTISFRVRDIDNNAVYSCAASNPLTPRPLVTSITLSVVFPPKRVVIEGPLEAHRGDSVMLSCRSDVSNPPAKLRWLVDGVAFDSPDTAFTAEHNGWYVTSNLTAIITRQDKDVKAFTCIAHGAPEHENVFQTFNVSIFYPPGNPEITGYEDGSELRESDHQRFTCSASAGNPPADLRWYRGDVEVSSVTSVISGHISSILTLEIEVSDNEIILRCEVNNSAVTEPLTAEVKLNVIFPPPNVTISIDPPQPREGDTVRLECWSGSSNPAASIFWWKDDTLLKDQNQVETTDSFYGGSSTRSRLSLPLSSTDHGSRFTCEAKNDAFQRSVQEQITLHVLFAPVFLTSGKVVEMIEGRSGEVNMTAKANPEVYRYRWTKEGVPIPDRRDSYKQPSSVSADGSVLYFTRVSRHDSGAYTCVAQNLEGSASATLTLNVLYPATIYNISASTEVAEGETAHLECSADGNPLTEDTITWKGTDMRLLTFTNELGHSILTILNASRKDAGVLECVADNGIGLPSVRSTKLVVHYRPFILKKLLQRRVAAGEQDSVELKCIAEGYPGITFSWSFNGSTIMSGHMDITKYRVHQKQKYDNEWWSTLTVNVIGPGDYGVYTCVAGNLMGHDFITFSIVRRSVPDPPEALEALNVSHNGAVLRWSPGFDGGLTQSFQLRIRKNQAMPVAFVHIPMNSTSYMLSGLEQGTSYEVSAAAKNALGESSYTAPIILRTRSPTTDDNVPREKKLPSEDHSPFYLSRTSIDIPDDELDVDSLKKTPIKLHQVYRDSSEEGQSSGRRCDCGGMQWSSSLICGGRSPSEENSGNQHEHCPDILKRDNCHCHTAVPAGKRVSETDVEMSPTLGAVIYGKREIPNLSSDAQESKDFPSPPHITLTTFHSKSELPIRHTIIGPKLETVINGYDEDS